MKATQLLIRTYQLYMSICCMLQILLVILQNEIQSIYLSIIIMHMKILIQRLSGSNRFCGFSKSHKLSSVLSTGHR